MESLPTKTADRADAAARERDRFLDLLRAVALVRVVLWHASGWAPVTMVAAIPTMFFVSGTLFAASARRGALGAMADRLRRLLPPLWLFAAVSWAAMAVAAAANNTELQWSRLVWWVLPLADPAGSDWEGGWLSSPLWYMRALLWVLLAAPVLLRATRRAPVVTLSVLAAAVFVLDAGQIAGWFRPAWNERLLWQLGDLALYGLFFALGFRHRDGAMEGVSRRVWLAIAGVAAGAAVLWWHSKPPASGAVNDSQPLHLLVGVIWLAAAMASQGKLRQVALHPLMRAPVRFLGQRSLTVYLWHAPALAVGLAVTHRIGSHDLRWIGRYAVLATVGVAVAVAAFGWAEDLAARRRPRVWPSTPGQPRAWRLRPVGVTALVTLGLFVPSSAAGPANPSASPGFVPRVPSQAPPLPVVTDVPADRSWAASVELDGPLDDESLARVTDAWLAYHNIPGVSVALARPDGRTISTAAGKHADSRSRRVEDPVDVMSVTKLFTANLVYRQVDAGRIDLDAPIPPLSALPDLRLPPGVTVRQLLSHRSGLANYRDLPRYKESPTEVTTPEQALRLSATEVPWEGPAPEARYSSTNFIVLGYLLEQVTGRSYDDLLREELLEPLGLRRTTHLPPEPGEPRFAAAGIVADVGDLGHAALALLRDHVGISDASYREMTRIDPVASMGAGTMSYCPCTRPSPDRFEVFAIGYTGGSTWAGYIPRHDVVVIVDVTGALHEDHWGAVEALVQLVAEHGSATAA